MQQNQPDLIVQELRRIRRLGGLHDPRLLLEADALLEALGVDNIAIAYQGLVEAIQLLPEGRKTSALIVALGIAREPEGGTVERRRALASEWGYSPEAVYLWENQRIDQLAAIIRSRRIKPHERIQRIEAVGAVHGRLLVNVDIFTMLHEGQRKFKQGDWHNTHERHFTTMLPYAIPPTLKPDELMMQLEFRGVAPQAVYAGSFPLLHAWTLATGSGMQELEVREEHGLVYSRHSWEPVGHDELYVLVWIPPTNTA